MTTNNVSAPARELVGAAAALLKQRAEEVNRLNVFPVPDGDTGTNMSLTMETVVRELSSLPDDAGLADVCKAVSHGSLMGARGNSGVILSQILRGLCLVVESAGHVDTNLLAEALDSAVTVSFQAVRKPVEGTMLTVIKDAAAAAGRAAADSMPLDAAFEHVTAAAYESVKRTPELLPVLKENGVVDAGGFGLAILLEGFVSALLGRSLEVIEISSQAAPLRIDQVNDWDDDEYLYCTEFLLFGASASREALQDFVGSIGGSELVVGDEGEYKIHVHTDDPGSVLSHMTSLGEVAEVHINNMRRQTAERDEMLRAQSQEPSELKPLGIVAVAAGEGLADILRSLGVDVVVSGGQTMNPSTEDLLRAIESVAAESVIVLPNNKNIVMAAQAATGVSSKLSAVVPTTSVPAAFSALLAFDAQGSVADVVEAMTEAASSVKTGEVTTAVKDASSKQGPIKAGQVIGIIDDKEIEFVGDSVDDVAMDVARMLASDADTLTLFAGKDYSDEELDALSEAISNAFPDLEVEAHRGEQPLYPVILAAE